MLALPQPSSESDGQSALLLEKTAQKNESVAKVDDGEPDYSSVITQVTKRESPALQPQIHAFSTSSSGQHHPHQHSLPAPAEQPDSSWSARLKSILCCFTPSTKGYVRSRDHAPAGPHIHLPTVAHSANVSQPAPEQPLPTLIGPKRAEDTHKKTLVLDLDETLVHSSFKPIPSPDYILPVEIDGKVIDVYVLKRPWCDHFMESVGHRFEVVVFTASLSKYADPLLDLLDKAGVVRWRLFRESCVHYEGNYVKDLACLGRCLSDTIIVDNSPHSYLFQPTNALPVGTFIDNMEDQELLDLLPVLQATEYADDVREVLQDYTRTLIARPMI